jgi:hypothetical protein
VPTRRPRARRARRIPSHPSHPSVRRPPSRPSAPPREGLARGSRTAKFYPNVTWRARMKDVNENE